MYNFTFQMKSRLFFFMLCMLFSSASLLHAQSTITIDGTVTAASDGVVLPGVSVKLKGTTTGTVTDVTGRFSIKVPASGAILEISYLGFKTQEVAVNNSGSNLTVILTEDAAALNEVVVIGYGTTRREDLTGTISVVTSKDFQKGNITTPEQLISGKVPGVSITSNGGQPGAGSTIRIRGGSSLNASNDPLFVIDGVPVENTSISGASNPLSFINPNDIESFTVLKDASAAAIYGARASNGVIIITTKKGQSGALKVNFSTVNSVSDIVKYSEVLSADQFREVVQANGTSDQVAMLGNYNTNWQDKIYQLGASTDNNVTFNGGIKNLPYRLSVGYQNQTGILKTDELQKTSAALVLNPTFFDNHLKVDLNLKGSMQKTRFANTAAIGGAVSFDPTQAIYTNRENFGGYWEWQNVGNPSGLENLVGRNPVGLLYQRENRAKPLRSIGNLQIDDKFHFLPELRANLNLGYDVADGKGTTFVSGNAAELIDQGGENNQYRQGRTNTVVDFYLNYVKSIPSIKSKIDATAGYSYNDYLSKYYIYRTYLADGTPLGAAPTFPYDKPQYRLISYFGRLNYNYDERYYLTATVRQDGSSRFGPDYRKAVFPSVAVSWSIKNESFLKNVEKISALKLRMSYGITGQQDGLFNYSYLSTYNLSTENASYQFGDAYYQMYRPSAYIYNIKWEETATANLGIDFGLWDNRVTGSIDLYQKKTNDLLNRVPQPAGTNFSATAVVNVGDMENKGVEFNVNVVPVKSQNFNWDAGFNLTYNENNITNLTVVPNDPKYIGFPSGSIQGGVGGQFAQINAVGGPKNTFYLFQQVYDSNGKPIEGVYVDQNGDGLITPDDKIKTKAADPKVFLGFSNNFSYKNWTASFVMRASLGNYVYSNAFSQRGTLNQVLGTAILLNASPNYLETNFRAQQLLSDYYIQNASFLKMDNLALGYDFGGVLKNNATLRLNATVQNVFVITKYDGIDPEVISGIDNNLYPRPRIFSLGLNLNF